MVGLAGFAIVKHVQQAAKLNVPFPPVSGVN